MVNVSTPIIHNLATVEINALTLNVRCQEKDISPLEYRQSSGGYSQQPKIISHPMELTPFNDFDTHFTEQTNKQTNKQKKTTGIGVQGDQKSMGHCHCNLTLPVTKQTYI